jgi:hypothetical protein
MSKQIVLRAALVGGCALMIGLAGCNKSDSGAALPPHPAGTAGPLPNNMQQQINSLPPEQRARALEQAQKASGGAAGTTQTDTNGKQ